MNDGFFDHLSKTSWCMEKKILQVDSVFWVSFEYAGDKKIFVNRVRGRIKIN